MSYSDQLVNANLSEKAYTNWNQSDIENSTVAYTDANGHNWTVYAVSESTGYDNGFYGVAFRNEDTKEVVVSFRGTDDLRDVTPDLQMAFGTNVPNQFQNAKQFYDDVVDKANGDFFKSPSLTGHSLGGALAQLVGAVTGAVTNTYNAPGVKDVLYNNPATFGVFSESATFDHINNYNTLFDYVSESGVQLGNSTTIFGGISQVALDWLKSPFEVGVIPVMLLKQFILKQHGIDGVIIALEEQGESDPMISLWEAEGLPNLDVLINSSPAPAALIDSLQQSFNSAQQQGSPIILDLDGNGISTVGFDAGVQFDHDGNGFAQLTGWVGANDGLLVWDRNANGVIDNGGELFGDNTVLVNGLNAVNGFAALAEHDSNGDGVIDADDAIWSELKVWRDQSQDGLTDEGELVTLDELGIMSISLSYTNSTYVDDQGNAHKQVGSFIWADGSVGTATDVWFAVDNARTRALDYIKVSDDIAALPELQAFGHMYSLHQAMARDESGQLRALVEQFVTETDRSSHGTLMTAILYEWVGVADLDPGSRGGLIDARKVAVLEAFLGEDFLQWGSPNPRTQAAALLDQAFGDLQRSLHGDLMLQSHFKPYIDAIEISIGAEGFECDFSVMNSMLSEYQQAGKLQDVALALFEFDQFVGKILKPLGWESSEIYPVWFQGTDNLIHNSGILQGTVGNDLLYGGEGNDTLNGGSGNDLLVGGGGNDYLNGGRGNDTYLFDIGWGQDTVYDYDTTVGNIDTLVFGEGIAPEDLVFSRSGNHLIIRRSGSDDQITVQNYYSSAYYRIERMAFADGTVWDEDTINRRPLFGSEGDDSFTGIGSVMTLYGLAGNDTLSGGSGNDLLYGGEGNDTLNGGSGNDLLVGGVGNDYLNGGRGNDTYLFDKGWGQDTINDYDTTVGNIDTFVFGEGIAPDDLVFSRSGNHLIIRRSGSADQITVQNYYSSAYYRIERMAFADGTVWDEDTINRRPLFGSEGDDSFTGIGSVMTLYGLAGNDTLNGGNGNDLLVGGSGNDYLNGGRGNDTYLFDKGWGQDTVYDYDTTSGNIDTLVFGEGIAPEDLVFSRSGNHLIIRRSGSDDQITVQNYYSSAYYRIERMAFADGTVWDEDTINRRPLFGSEGDDSLTGLGSVMTLYGLAGNDTLNGGSGDDFLYGGEGNDTLNGGSGNDILYGGEGNDTLNGGAGNDLLVGGVGNDYLNGGRGNDTYLFDIGWGQDTVFDYDTTVGNIDTFVFGAGIAPDDLVFSRSGNHLIIRRSGSADQITVQNYYSSAYYRIERMAFADGTVWDEDTINRRPLYGGEGNDSFTGIGSAMTLYGLGGDDILNGGSGDDFLYGGEGNDTLNSGSGNDLLVGGVGNDYLNGGRGNDTYLFDKGWGQDTVYDYDTTSGNIDTLVFGEGIAPEDLVFSRSGNHLIIRRSGSADQITVQNYYAHSYYRIERMAFADGTVWDEEAIFQRPLYGGEGNDSFTGIGSAMTLYGLAGDDTLTGGNGNDLLYGGEGNDTLNGGSGNDLLVGGVGNDYLNGGRGNDTYLFGVGDGNDTINNYDTSGFDRILFDVGVSTDSIAVFRNGNHLDIGYGTDDRITVSNHFSSSSYAIDQLQLANGSYLTDADINQLLQEMSAYAVNEGIALNSIEDVRQHHELMAMVAGSWQAA